MEAKTKYSFIITVCAILGFFIFNAFKPDVATGKFLTLKVVEYPGVLYNSFYVIVDENGKSEEVFFDKKASIENITANTVMITKVMNDISTKGYDLACTSSASNGSLLITNYTFLKK